MIKHYFIFYLLICSFSAFAEYRAYQYIINNDNKEKSNIIITTYDPVTLKSYNITPHLNYELIRTWICPGNTASKDTCPSP